MTKKTAPAVDSAESGKRETFLLYSTDRDILARRVAEARKSNPEADKSKIIRGLIRGTEA